MANAQVKPGETNAAATNKPCYAQKKICNLKVVANCRELVAFDESTHTYLSKNDYHTPYSGTCASCYQSGALQEQLTIIDGKRDSTGEAFYESGCIQSRQTFIMGKLNGKSVFYYDSTGKKEVEVNHHLDKLNGTYILFENNPTNDTLKLITYQNNVYDGVQKEYYDQNKVMKIVHYKDGILDGKHQIFSYEGKIESDMNYVNGQKDGAWKFYFPDGKIAHVETWTNGIKDGEFATYNEKGEFLFQEFYKKGIPDGKHILNFPNGKPKHITFYEKGEKVEEYEFEELTGARNTLIERKEKKKKKDDAPAPQKAASFDNDLDKLLEEKTPEPADKKKKGKN